MSERPVLLLASGYSSNSTMSRYNGLHTVHVLCRCVNWFVFLFARGRYRADDFCAV